MKKINSKWVKNLNRRADSVKLLKENVEQKLFDVGLGNYFLGMTIRAQVTKGKIWWDHSKLTQVPMENCQEPIIDTKTLYLGL